MRSDSSPLGKTGATACIIDTRGDGKRSKLSILTDDAPDGVVNQASFAPAPDAWQTLCLPLADFRPSFRGREVRGAPPLQPSRIRQVGLLIGDRQEGAFSLQVKRIGLD